MMTLVLLPGMDGTGTLYESFITALGPSYIVKVVRYPTNEPMGYSELEAIARAAIPSEGPFIILGESFSGPIAISLAATCSSQLKGLILCCTFVKNPQPLFSGFKSFINMLPVAVVPKAMFNFFLLGSFSNETLRSALSSAVAHVSSSTFRTRLKAVLSVNVSEKFRALKVPVLYLRASQDRVVPRASSELVLLLNSRCKVVEVEAPHFLLQAAPVKAAQVVGTFALEAQNAF
jgi:pimeloyl-ACP methyl ester carboxylesterase